MTGAHAPNRGNPLAGLLSRCQVSLPSRIRVVEAPRNRHLGFSVPGSKSAATRALVLAGCRRGPTEIRGLLAADDPYWGAASLWRLGFGTSYALGTLEVTAPRPGTARTRGLYLGASGTLARFFPSVVLNLGVTLGEAISAGVRLQGSSRLRERPLLPLMGSLRELGGKVTGDGLPAWVWPSELAGETTVCGTPSGQFLSGLLLAAAGSRGGCTVTLQGPLVQPGYVGLTERAIASAGGHVERSGDRFVVWPPPSSVREGPLVLDLPPDASSACALLCAAAVLGCSAEFGAVSFGPQPDTQFGEFLERLGARMGSGLSMEAPPPPTCFGGFSFDFSKMSDQALGAGVLGVFADAPIRIRGVGHVREHECDRISCLVANLRAVGGHAQAHEDGFTVYPASFLRGVWKSCSDHRMAMAGTALAARFTGIAVEDPGAAAKTFPGFYDELGRAGVEFASGDPGGAAPL